MRDAWPTDYRLYLFPDSLYVPARMSADEKPYDPLYIQAWTLLSILVGVLILGMLVFGPHLLHFFHWIWDLLRYLSRPII